MSEFKSMYGRSDAPSRDDMQWLSTGAEYVSCAGLAEQAEQDVRVLGEKVSPLKSQASTVPGIRQRAYGDYVVERESHEESRGLLLRR